MKKSCSKDGCHSEDLERIISEEQILNLLENLDGWRRSYCFPEKLIKEYYFENFTDGLELVNKVSIAAEKMNHHPWIVLEWGRVKIEIWTHSVAGLTELDFVLAKEIDYIK